MNTFQVIFIIVACRTLYVRWNGLKKAIKEKNQNAIKGEAWLFLAFLIIGIGLQYFHQTQSGN
jgi:uncharacterized protein HemX